ncbi:hypothetical protein [Pseudobutyrivibrio xylanivorans]|uniref:AP2/ERF domain-containing protein n=1 Tax=Pseudobutyrivibrio xylanivorans TaxID=185007 RepID=A0A5P6VSW5_PSEXY|nr:hypothetical protein [Pseudobutyrivibrio xylanivorans]QFJ55753.1 hypothetical protein FXF36_13115 [Pseudobutyrivibrio xylanivorans]
MKPGVYESTRKNGDIYYRGNITYNGKHISIGSFDSEAQCNSAYKEAWEILKDNSITLLSYQNHIYNLPFDKVVTLINFRDNHIYIKNPIYLQKNYFVYYLDASTVLKFDNDDLFYYSSHKIQNRGGHMFVTDYGMQYNILGRYGIKPYSVIGRDYKFANGDCYDFRYSNIIVINKYHGVSKEIKKGKSIYTAKIHLNGDFIVGRYNSEAKAAVAYNKAVDLCKSRGMRKVFPTNFVTEFSPREYADVYTELKISSHLYKFFKNKNFREA